jgi:hypothetical protein
MFDELQDIANDDSFPLPEARPAEHNWADEFRLPVDLSKNGGETCKVPNSNSRSPGEILRNSNTPEMKILLGTIVIESKQPELVQRRHSVEQEPLSQPKQPSMLERLWDKKSGSIVEDLLPKIFNKK